MIHSICSVVAVFKMLVRILNTLPSRIWDLDNIFMRNVLKGTEEGVKQMCKELKEMRQFFRI